MLLFHYIFFISYLLYGLALNHIYYSLSKWKHMIPYYEFTLLFKKPQAIWTASFFCIFCQWLTTSSCIETHPVDTPHSAGCSYCSTDTNGSLLNQKCIARRKGSQMLQKCYFSDISNLTKYDFHNSNFIPLSESQYSAPD